MTNKSLLKPSILLLLAFGLSSCHSCPAICTDQTVMQDDYAEARDQCRELADLKVEMVIRNSAGAADDKQRKNHLVSIFSECMGNKGWSVPVPGGDTKALAAAATSKNPSTPLAVPALKTPTDAETRRGAECAFSRHSRRVSSMAENRAQACDLECSQRKHAYPLNPPAAACNTTIPTEKF